jgi:mannose-6-phosphate isomerase
MSDSAPLEAFASELARRPRPLELVGAIQPYAWGGFEFIPRFVGREVDQARPAAELWLGAHPVAPATVTLAGRSVPLDELSRRAASLLFGSGVSARFGGLPYLLKVLDVRTMLSIQAHPTREQAAEGFAREEAGGVDPAAPARNYRDRNHKPEMQVPLTEFWMLYGFRPLDDMARAVGRAPELRPVLPELFDPPAARPRHESDLIRTLYGRVMTMPRAEVDRVLAPLSRRVMAEYDAGLLARDDPEYWAAKAAAAFPPQDGGADRGLFSIYLLNLVRLSPWQATFIPAGVLHAYLEGVAVEIMASSDNVLRGGLTPKHVDVAELLRILSFASGAPLVVDPEPASAGEERYAPPVAEFALSRLQVSPALPFVSGPVHGADTLLVLDGEARLVSDETMLSLARGRAALVPDGVVYRIEGTATLVRAFVPGT